MKILYIGIYDYACDCNSYELVNNKFVYANISFSDMDRIRDLSKFGYLEADETKQEKFDALSDKVKSYDAAIICENSEYEYINLNKYKNKN